MGTNQVRCEQRYEQRYEQWAAPLRGRPGVVRALNIVNRGIVVVFYAAYALLLGWACVSDPWRLVPLVGVTAVGFVAVSFFRRRFNAPRPYECCAIAALIARDGAGKSFPSRHAFSAFAIAASWFAASAPVAVVLLVAAFMTSAACTFRVMSSSVPSLAPSRVRLLLFWRRCSKGLTWGLQPKGACSLRKLMPKVGRMHPE